MLNNEEIATLLAKLREDESKYLCLLSTEDRLKYEENVDYDRSLREDLGIQVAGDFVSRDEFEAMSEDLQIDFDTLQQFSVDDILLLHQEWCMTVTTKRLKEIYPPSFEEECYLGYKNRIISEVGVVRFLAMEKEKREERHQRENSGQQPSQMPNLGNHRSL